MACLNKTPFILFLFLAVKAQLVAGQVPLSFKHITAENGLSSGSVLSIAQDQKGFIWAGTMDGLNRYDGRTIKIFRTFYRDNFIGTSIKISELLADNQQNLWIGTNNGLYIYDTRLDSFRVFYSSAADKNSLCHSNIKSLALDRKGNIWVGTPGGLSKIIPGARFTFHCIPINYTDGGLRFNDVQAVNEISGDRIAVGTTNGLVILSKENATGNRQVLNVVCKGNSITSIAEDNNNVIWAGTNGTGVFRVDSLTSVKQYLHKSDSRLGPVSNIIRKIIVDRKGRLWIGTLKGLNLFHPSTETFETYVHNPNDENTLNFNSIWDIVEDMQGSIWVGTFFGGLNVAESITTPFTVYRNEESANSISSNVVGPVIADERNNLWIGTEAEGLNYFDRTKQQFKRFRSDETNPNTLSSNLVKTLIPDKNNHIWVGMHGGGINVIDALGRIVKRFNSKQPSNALNSDDVIALLLDNKNRVWIGTEDDGLNIYDFSTNKVEKFETVFPDKNIVGKGITCLFKDSKQNIWIGTGRGLSKLNTDEITMTNFVKSSAHGQLLSDCIYCITEGANGLIWLGTYSGLSYYDPVSNKFATFTTANGLAGNKVVGIVVDDHNGLWISTNKGLSYLDSARKSFHSFTTDDGLPGNVFNFNSFFKNRLGHIFLGGYKGLVEFNPDDIQINKAPPGIMFTGLTINSQPIQARDRTAILPTSDFSETNEIRLAYDQNVLLIDYAVMNFIKPAKNRSAYKLEGYNTDWQYTNGQSASFTNLPPGHYRLLIKACNNDGIWNSTPAVLKITVFPPPWKTWWAYTLYALAIILLLSGIIYFFASRAALRRKLRHEHLMNVKQQELHQMKMDFFTHISHEIRTPLTLIAGPVEMLMSKMAPRSENYKWLLAIKSNAERLLKLTTDLLEFRKADSGYTQLKLTPANLVHFAHAVYEKFTVAAFEKLINYTFESEGKEIEVYFDAHHMEIVLSNLLSNAVKFTPEGGNIAVQVVKKGLEAVEINVCDDGVGIPKECQDKIFTNFYQAENGKLKHSGSGIGLAFSKSLVELHHGQLNFSSEKDAVTGKQKTCFVITLNLGTAHLNQRSLQLNDWLNHEGK